MNLMAKSKIDEYIQKRSEKSPEFKKEIETETQKLIKEYSKNHEFKKIYDEEASKTEKILKKIKKVDKH